jgi:hypothetical protein
VSPGLDSPPPQEPAHAEINAIRQTEQELGTHDLTGCENGNAELTSLIDTIFLSSLDYGTQTGRIAFIRTGTQ